MVDEGKLDHASRHLKCGGYDSNGQTLLLARGEWLSSRCDRLCMRVVGCTASLAKGSVPSRASNHTSAFQLVLSLVPTELS